MNVESDDAVEREANVIAICQDLVRVPLPVMRDGLANQPALIRGLHDVAAAATLIVQVSPGGFLLTGFRGVSLIFDLPAITGELLAAELDAAVVVAEFDVASEDKIRKGSFVNQECVHLEWLSIAGSDEDSIFDRPPLGVAIPAFSVLAVVEECVAFLFFLGR